MHVDRALAEQLLQDQSDRYVNRVALPSAAAKEYHTTGAAAVHALDRKVPLKDGATHKTYNLLKNSSPSRTTK